MTKPRVEFHSRSSEGNIYYILGLVRNALQKQRRINDYNELWERVQKSGNYVNALAEIRKIVDLIDLDEQF